MLKIVDKNISEIVTMLNNLVFVCRGFNTIILCSFHSIWFVKYVFSAKIWFVKTSTKIVKYESQVVKSNLARGTFTELFMITIQGSSWMENSNYLMNIFYWIQRVALPTFLPQGHWPMAIWSTGYSMVPNFT